MSQSSDQGISDSDDVASTDAQSLPPPEALLAGTLALMTGHAQACCQGQRALMARKIIANLLMLSRHPSAPPDFRAIAANLHPLWMRLLRANPDQPQQGLLPADHSDPHRVLWHTTPETLQ